MNAQTNQLSEQEIKKLLLQLGYTNEQLQNDKVLQETQATLKNAVLNPAQQFKELQNLIMTHSGVPVAGEAQNQLSRLLGQLNSPILNSLLENRNLHAHPANAHPEAQPAASPSPFNKTPSPFNK
jgi:hypothetical protein